MSYATNAASATKLIAKKGQVICHTRNTEGTYDPATSGVTSTSTTKSRSGVVLDFNPGETNVRGTLIKTGDKRLLLAPLPDVSMQDTFTIQGVLYSVVSIGEVNPAGTRILYDLHITT